MKKVFVMFVGLLFVLSISAQSMSSDSVFCSYIYNDEYQVYMDIDFRGDGIKVPKQEVLGNVPGYLGAVRDSRKWLIAEVELLGKNKALLNIINDYGSEDLTATLIYDPKDKSYTLRQTGGSRLKIVVNRKWVKIPNDLKFIPHGRVESHW